MKLKIKFLKWSAGFPVVMLNKKTAEQMGVRSKDRISIKSKNKKYSTILDIVEDIIGKNEIAVSSELKNLIDLKERQVVDVSLSVTPKSFYFIQKKLNKNFLSESEIKEIIKDIVNNSLSETEIALFISAMYQQGTNMKETISLIKAILKTGERLDLRKKYVVDKHSIGGVSGRTTPIVVSICASLGLIFPKTSSRAITTAAGTADVMETLTNVNFSMNEIKKILGKTNACIVWGGGLEIAPADSKIIQIEKSLGIDPEAQLLASIMAKKLAVGSNYILIHIPYGKTAKVNKKKAGELKRKFEYLGRYFKKKLKVVLTKNNGPIGNGIGPVLEMIDVIKILDPGQKGPKKLEEESLFLSSEILEMTGKAKKGEGIRLSREILYSGKAFDKFMEIIRAQGGSLDRNKLKLSKFHKDIFSEKNGKIIEIDNKKINTFARIAGCPAEKSAGAYLYFNSGDKIRKKDKLITIYSESKSRLNQAVKYYWSVKPILIK